MHELLGIWWLAVVVLKAIMVHPHRASVDVTSPALLSADVESFSTFQIPTQVSANQMTLCQKPCEGASQLCSYKIGEQRFIHTVWLEGKSHRIPIFYRVFNLFSKFDHLNFFHIGLNIFLSWICAIDMFI